MLYVDFVSVLVHLYYVYFCWVCCLVSMCMFCCCCFFFFFKQKTAYEMRISDWSSDVCSSDLCQVVVDLLLPARQRRLFGLRTRVGRGHRLLRARAADH